MWLFKCITGLVSEKPIAVNVLTSSKNSCNMQKRTFILLFRPFHQNLVRKGYFWSDLRFDDCLITRWVPTTSILVLSERIYRWQIKPNYLKNRKYFAACFFFFFCIFGIRIKFPMFWKKNQCFEKKNGIYRCQIKPNYLKNRKHFAAFFFFFFAFLESELNFQCFEKKMSLIAQVFLKLLTPRDVLV